MDHKTIIFRTRFGWMGLVGTPKGIARIVLPRVSRGAVAFELAPRAMAGNGRRAVPSVTLRGNGAGAVETVLGQAREQLTEFLQGTRQVLNFPLDLAQGSSFQRRVWLAARRIPFGRVRSYGWIAARVGGPRYARAVGHALGSNPVPVIVPCHRVVGHDGSLTGFAGGLPLKRKLLELEGTYKQLQRHGREAR